MRSSSDSLEWALSIYSTKCSHWILCSWSEPSGRRYGSYFSMNGWFHEDILIPMSDNFEWSSWQDFSRVVEYRNRRYSVSIRVSPTHDFDTRLEFHILISDSSESVPMGISHRSSLLIHFSYLSQIRISRSLTHRSLQPIVSRSHRWWSET